MVQYVKLPLEMPIFHSGMLVQVLAISSSIFQMHLGRQVLGSLANHMRDLDGLLDS